MKMYMINGGSSWYHDDGWGGTSNHCEWHGLACDYNMIRSIHFVSNNVKGPFPELSDIDRFHTVRVAGNEMTGPIPNELCSDSLSGIIDLYGDAHNCPNNFDYDAGIYLPGCCNSVRINVTIYLENFAKGILGSDDCGNFGGVEADVCSFMIDEANHDIFENGFPSSFNGNVWKWLKVSHLEYISS